MGKNGSKTLKEKWQEFKQNNPNLRIYLLNWYFPIALLAVLMGFLFSYLTNPELIKKEMLFWFFASCSQSMAALFAVIGMFAVFRYQDMQNRLRNLYDSLKNKFSSGQWITHFRNEIPQSWEDSAILDKVNDILRDRKDDLPEIIINNLDVSSVVIKSHEDVRNNIIKFAKVPMSSILITFMLSIFSLLFTKAYFSLFFLNYLGFAILLTTLLSITFSMLSVFKYFIITIPSSQNRIF